MKLLGDWNWYLPKWLEWLPSSSTRGSWTRGPNKRRRSRRRAGSSMEPRTRLAAPAGRGPGRGRRRPLWRRYLRRSLLAVVAFVGGGPRLRGGGAFARGCPRRGGG